MRKPYILVFALFGVLAGCKHELPIKSNEGETAESKLKWVSTERQTRNVILERFAGVRMGYERSADEIATGLHFETNGRVIPIAIHAGGLASPFPGIPDFRTPFGDKILEEANTTAFPSGMINRAAFIGKGINGGLAIGMGRQHWEETSRLILKDTSSVNIGGRATYDTTTRQLHIDVELYYLEDETRTNMLNIALLQDRITAYQSQEGSFYEHRHMLRHLLTGQWGAEIPESHRQKGRVHIFSFDYIVPPDYNGPDLSNQGGGVVVPEDLELVVFVARGQTNIITGEYIPIRFR